MLFAMNSLLVPAAAGGVALSVNYVGTVAQASTTFSSYDLGTPAAGRILVFGYGGYKGSSIGLSSLTVAGSAATKADSPANNTRYCAIWYIEDSTNSSGTVTLGGASANYHWLDCWEILGASSATPVHTSTTGTLSGYASRPVVAIGVGQAQSSGMSLTGLTTDYSENDGSDHYHIAGSSLVESAGGTYTVNGSTTEVVAGWA